MGGCYNVKLVDIMASDKRFILLSEVEQLVLLAVLKIRADAEAYAVPIRRLIQQEAGVALPRGSVYVTLDRLEQKGLLESWLSEPTSAPGGKARRVFRLRPAGMAALRSSTKAMQRMTAGTVLVKG